MELTLKGIKDVQAFNAANIKLPQYGVKND